MLNKKYPSIKSKGNDKSPAESPIHEFVCCIGCSLILVSGITASLLVSRCYGKEAGLLILLLSIMFMIFAFVGFLLSDPDERHK